MKLFSRLRQAPLTAFAIAPFFLVPAALAAPALLPWALPALLAACAVFCLLLPGFELRTQALPVFFCVYALAEALCRIYARGEWGEAAKLGAPWLHGCFIGFFVLSCLALNQETLYAAVRRGRRPPAEQRRRGLLWTILMTAGTVFLSLSPVWARGLAALWAWLKAAIRAAAAFLGSLMAREEAASGMPGGGGGGLLPVEAADPNPILRLLEKALSYLTAVILGALLFFVLRTLIRKAREGILRLITRVRATLRRLSRPVEEDFVDEVESSELAPLAVRGLLRRRERLSNLPPREGIRLLYRRQLRRHREWGPGATARENLPRAAEYYERSRYSELPVTQEDVQAFQERLREES